MKNELFSIVEPMMQAQQDMYKVGYTEGYHKGYLAGLDKAKVMVSETFKKPSWHFLEKSKKEAKDETNL